LFDIGATWVDGGTSSASFDIGATWVDGSTSSASFDIGATFALWACNFLGANTNPLAIYFESAVPARASASTLFDITSSIG